MFLLLVLVTLLAAQSHGASETAQKFKALRFTQEPSSFIQFNPDFSRLTQALSVCGWIKALGTATWPTVFYYGSAELTMLSDGNYICIFNSCQHLQDKFSVSKGTWFHTCVTWSVSSRSHKYYVNGELLGSQQTPSGRLLNTGEKLTLGNWGGNAANHEFGGEMAYLNFYAKELSTREVGEMAAGGMCYDIAVDKHEEVRLLKWEDILKKSRSGTVTEADMTSLCTSTIKLLSQLEQVVGKLNETTEKLSETQQALEEKKETELNLYEEIKNVSSQLNSTLVTLEEVLTELNKTEEELGECSRRLNQTEEEHGRATEKLQNYNQTKNIWDWNIFLSGQYINKTITSEQAEQIRSSWDDVAQKLIGYKITDALIKFWKIVDCTELEDRPWSMLYSERYHDKILTQELADGLTSVWEGVSEKLVGVTMTEEVVELLNYVSEETNCYCGN